MHSTLDHVKIDVLGKILCSLGEGGNLEAAITELGSFLNVNLLEATGYFKFGTPLGKIRWQVRLVD